MYHKPGELVATRAIIQNGNKVLLGKREHGSGAGQFALIGGKPDKGETLVETIIREVGEETGLEFINPVLWKVVKDSKSVPGENWDIYFFIGVTVGQLVLKEDEISEVIYVTAGDLNKLDIAFNHREILNEFFCARI